MRRALAVARGLLFSPAMPTAKEIIRGLALTANEASGISIAWHVAVGIAVIALVAGFRPQQRFAAVLLSAPLTSVSVLAFAYDNPFNGAVFALLASVLAALALRAPTRRVTLGRRWCVQLGSLLIIFGWIYPHFLEGVSGSAYLYAAPLGAIPCPTLSLVIGAALVAGGFSLRLWRLVLAAAGCFYALVGALHLGVLIDLILLVGAAGLLVQYAQDRIDSARRERIIGIGGVGS